MKHLLLFIFGTILSSGIYAQTQLLADTSLEASGPNNSPWSSTSTNFGTSFCDAAGCGTCGGPCVPNSGSWYAWFGGTTSAETGTIAQGFNATTAGSGTLTYFMKVPLKGAIGDTLSIIMDGTAIDKINTVDSIGDYQQMTLNIGAVTVGSHNLTIQFQKQASAAVVNVLVDDVKLTIGGTVGVEEIDFSNGIQISNNIETGNISVAYNFDEIQHIRLTATDLSGKVLYSDFLENQTANMQTINSTGWSAGIYTISIVSDKGLVKNHKVVVN
ncbi:T9SS type A sorting domain-containing protein [Fluviicola taffensis]|uniref:T9SS type A sorting domain-containing protein n=1 Tax=Fluviicola taffensis TaxID=191579 RepID=UPI0031383474